MGWGLDPLYPDLTHPIYLGLNVYSLLMYHGLSEERGHRETTRGPPLVGLWSRRGGSSVDLGTHSDLHRLAPPPSSPPPHRTTKEEAEGLSYAWAHRPDLSMNIC